MATKKLSRVYVIKLDKMKCQATFMKRMFEHCSSLLNRYDIKKGHFILDYFFTDENLENNKLNPKNKLITVTIDLTDD